MRYGMVINLKRCIGCNSCTVACKQRNATPPGVFWNGVLIGETGTYPNSRLIQLPLQCMHCEDARCVEVCPTKACHIDSKTNTVLIDKDKCIGCRTCILACPFGVPLFDKAERVTVKCDYCDGEPQCVRFCDVDAIKFIDVGEVSGLYQYAAAEKFTNALRKSTA